MEANRPSSTKWVSRRTLDSQAHNRDHSAAAPQLPQPPQQQGRGHTPQHGSPDNANANSNNIISDRRKYGNTDFALSGAGNARGNGGGNGGGDYRAHSGNRFGGSTSGSITSSAGSSINKGNHHGMGYSANTVNPHTAHGQGNNGSNGRRGYGYGDPVEPTMPPPPRSVQMGQGTLPAHVAARDLIPQPRHARASSGVASATTPKPTDHATSPGAVEAAAAATTRRWASSTSTPTPRSAHSNPAVSPTSHHDPHAGLAVPRSSPSSPFMAASGGQANATPAPPLPPPPLPPRPASASLTAMGVATLGGNALPPPPGTPLSVAAPAPRSSAAAAPTPPTVTSPLETLQISEHLIFDPQDFDEPVGIQPSEIEALLGQVERSTAAAAAAAAASTGARESALGGSLRERRSVADWGIEEAIKSVLPGMDEDDNFDDQHGPNVFGSSGGAAISGSWHTTGDADARQPVGAGLLADFPTSFAASFSEPTSAVLGSPFAGDPAASAMDNLSRAFSTAARVDSSSFATSPATTSAATPLQRPPNSPGLHLPHYTAPDEAVAMPPSTRDVALLAKAPGSTPAEALHHPSVPREETTTNDSIVTAADLLTLFPSPSMQLTPKGGPTSPWLSSGNGDVAVVAAASRASDGAELGASKASTGSAERPSERRPPHTSGGRPTGLLSIPIKNASIESSGLTASISANSPAVLTTHQSPATVSSHGIGSAPNTPSLKKETSTPLSATRSQPYTPGGTRPQRPSLSAPVVNRQSITQIFRETPQSLLRKERMEHNHEHSGTALCKDAQWPPRNEVEVDQMLRGRGATKLLRHLTIISFSRQHVNGVQDLFDTWAKNGIPAPDMGFGAYYYYVKEKSEKLLCMKHNGRGPSPGHGYGRCDFESRRPYSTCRYEHVCLFCRSKEHGWFEEGKCQGYQQLMAEMEELGITEDDVVTLLNAMERSAKTTWSR